MIVVKFGGHAMNDTQGIFAAAIKSAKQRQIESDTELSSNPTE